MIKIAAVLMFIVVAVVALLRGRGEVGYGSQFGSMVE